MLTETDQGWGEEGGEEGEPSRGYIRTLVNQRRKEMHGEKDEAVSAVVTGRDIHAHVMHTSLPGAAIRLSTRGVRLPRWSHCQRSSSTPAEQTNLAATVTIKIIIGPRDRRPISRVQQVYIRLRCCDKKERKKKKIIASSITVDIGKLRTGFVSQIIDRDGRGKVLPWEIARPVIDIRGYDFNVILTVA